MNDNQTWQLIHGDALKVLGSFAPNTFDAVITDPPYASGGRTQAEKNRSTARKYSSMGENAPPPFEGDAKDQRSWTRWVAEWLYEARKVCKPGAPVCMFIDWRQLPAASDALQWAGWIWRGTAVWDKGNSRPQKGRFRQQAEYIVWGSNGDMPISRPVLPVANLPAGGFLVLGVLCAVWRAAAQQRKRYLKTEADNLVSVHRQKEMNREHE